MPNTDKNGAQVIAERVRKAVFDLHWEHSGNTAADYVTISIGIGTCIPSTGQTVDTLIKMADESLYKAKEQGRNRIY